MAGSGVQLSQEELCDSLDQLAIQQLELMDSLIKSNMAMEERMRYGFFLLGKTRYTLGSTAVTALHIPSGEAEIESLATVVSSLVPLEGYGGDLLYHRMQTQFGTPHDPGHEGKQDHIAQEGEGLRRRRGAAEGHQEVEEMEQDDGRGSHKTVQHTTSKKTDPIRWFSALPPKTLRQAQAEFQAAVRLVSECASVQLKLRAVSGEYGRLSSLRRKLDSVEKEA